MIQDMISTQTGRLLEILAQEQELLLAGRAREVVSLAAEKLETMEQLEKFLSTNHVQALSPQQRDQIRRVKTAASENGVYFEAVRNGMRHAIRRMETMHANAFVGSYTQSGGQLPFSEVTGGYQKRA